MSLYPPGLLNARNRALERELLAQQQRLRRMRMVCAQDSRELDADVLQAGELKRELAESEVRLRLRSAELSEEQRLLAVSTREVSRVEAEIRNAREEEGTLLERLEQVAGSVDTLAQRISSMRRGSVLGEEEREAVQAASAAAERRASELNRVTEDEAKAITALLAERDRSAAAAAAARSELQAEEAEAAVLQSRIANVEKGIHDEHRERTELIRSCEDVALQQSAQGRREESLRAAGEAAEAKRRALEAERQRLQDTAAELLRDNAEQQQRIDAAARKRDGLPLHVRQREEAFEELDTEAEVCRGAVHRAVEQLYALRGELREAEAELRDKSRRLTEVEAAKQEMEGILDAAQAAAGSDDAISRRLDALRASVSRAAAQATQRLHATVAGMHKSMQENAAEGRRGDEMMTKLRSAEFGRERLKEEMQRAAEEKSSLTAKLAALRTEETVRQALLADAHVSSKQAEQRHLVECAAMQAELDARTREHAALVSIRGDATQALSAARQQTERRGGELSALQQAMTETEAELKGLGEEIQQQAALRRDRHAWIDALGGEEQRLREAVERKLDMLGGEERRREDLEETLAVREEAVQTAVAAQRQELRAAEEERRALAQELTQKKQALAALRTRYDETLRALHTLAIDGAPDEDRAAEGDAVRVRDEKISEAGPEELFALALCGRASLRSELQDRGDRLDAAVAAAEKKLKHVDRAHRLFMMQAESAKKDMAVAVWKSPTAYEVAPPKTADGARVCQELQALREQCAALRGEADGVAAAITTLDLDLSDANTGLRLAREDLAAALSRRKQLTANVLEAKRRLDSGQFPVARPLRADPTLALPPHPQPATAALQQLHRLVVAASGGDSDAAFYHVYRQLLARCGLEPPADPPPKSGSSTPLRSSPRRVQERRSPSQRGVAPSVAAVRRTPQRVRTPSQEPRRRPPATPPVGRPATPPVRRPPTPQRTDRSAAVAQERRRANVAAAAAGLGWVAGAPGGRRSSSIPSRAMPTGRPQLRRDPRSAQPLQLTGISY